MQKLFRAGAAAALLLATAQLAIGAGAAHSAPYYEVTDSIPVNGAPYEATVDSVAHRAYVPQPDANVVSVVDTTTKTVVDTIAVGNNPAAVAVDHARDRAYVVEYVDQKLAEIDTTTDTVVKRYDIGIQSLAVAVDPTTHKVYVSNNYSWTVTVIDPDATSNPEATISVPNSPVGIAVDPSLQRAYVARARTGDVAVIDTTTNTVTGTIPTGGLAYKVALDPSTHRLYVANNSGNSVSVIDTTSNTVIDTITGIPAPVAISLDPAQGLAYVANNKSGDSKVTVIDTATNSVRATVPTDSQAYGIAVDTDTHDVFVPQQDTGRVAVITPGETAPQTITFTTSLTNGKVGDTRQIAATGGDSGNPVTFSTTSRACTVTSTGDSTASVTYVHTGQCLVKADQAGSLRYDAATQQQSTATVARGTQSVRFTSTAPRRATVGGTYEVTASGTASGQPVLLAIANDDSAVCTFSSPPTTTGSTASATVSFTGPGRCTVRALQDGDADYKHSRVVKQGIAVR